MDLLENQNLNLDLLETYFNSDEIDKPLEANFEETENIELKYNPSIHEDFDINDEFPIDESNDDDTKNNVQIKIPKKISSNGNKDCIDWPQEDLDTLIKRIELALPEKDNLAFNTRVEKLNWDELSFQDYSGEDCKKTWMFVQKRIRRFRLLSEVLQDAKEWLSNPRKDYYRRKKTRNWPGMPRRPVSAYMLFYFEIKDEIQTKHPTFDMNDVTKEISQTYKNLPTHEKEKYTKMALNEKKEYQDKLNEFYRKNPKIEREHQEEKPAEFKPSARPSTPFYLYYKQQFKVPHVDNLTFKEDCKKQWKILPDNKKLSWINLALEGEAKYQDELKIYMEKNPDFVPPALKPVVNKEEKALKERLAGKPIKPPNSAYALFTAMMLQSEEIKKIPPNGRMKAVAAEWKNSSVEEKLPFQERVVELAKQYKENFALYLDSLPEYERRAVEAQNAPKRKMKNVEKIDMVPGKKKKLEGSKDAGEEPKIMELKKEISIETVPKNKERIVTNERTKPNNEINFETNKKITEIKEEIKIKPASEIKKKKSRPPKQANGEVNLKRILNNQPPKPPMSGIILFRSSYKGSLPIKVAWKGLSEFKREHYNGKVKKMKQKYIFEYEKFLKSLSKQELCAFSQFREKDGNNSDGKEEESCDSDDCGSDNE